MAVVMKGGGGERCHTQGAYLEVVIHAFADRDRAKMMQMCVMCTFSDVAIRRLPKVTCGEQEAGSVAVVALTATRCDR